VYNRDFVAVRKRSCPDGGAVETFDEKLLSMGRTNGVRDKRGYGAESRMGDG
jgi:hypothetical protein